MVGSQFRTVPLDGPAVSSGGAREQSALHNGSKCMAWVRQKDYLCELTADPRGHQPRKSCQVRPEGESETPPRTRGVPQRHAWHRQFALCRPGPPKICGRLAVEDAVLLPDPACHRAPVGPPARPVSARAGTTGNRHRSAPSAFPSTNNPHRTTSTPPSPGPQERCRVRAVSDPRSALVLYASTGAAGKPSPCPGRCGNASVSSPHQRTARVVCSQNAASSRAEVPGCTFPA